MVGIDARGGKVATRGWLETSEIDALDLAQRMATVGAGAIIYTDIYRDGTLEGPNLEQLQQLATAIDIPIIASGGVSSTTDLLSLLSLESQGVTGRHCGACPLHWRCGPVGSVASRGSRSLAGCPTGSGDLGASPKAGGGGVAWW